MINLDTEKSLALDAQERYDIIAFAMDAADDNGFINSFIFERALYVYAAIMLYPARKDELSKSAANDLLATWNKLMEDDLFDDMMDDHRDTINVLTQEAQAWFEEYSDWAHSARGILDVVQQFSGGILQDAAARLTTTAEETGVKDILQVADDWGMTRDALKPGKEGKPKEENEESLFI